MAIASPATDIHAHSADVDLLADPIERIAAAVSAEVPLTRSTATPWERHYITLALVLDMLTAFAAGAIAFLAWPGSGTPPTQYFAFTLLLPVIWVSAVGLSGAYEKSRLSVGPEEFNRVAVAGVSLLATAATLSWLFDLEVARGFAAISIGGATVGTLGARYALRKYAHHQRKKGRFRRRTILVGTPASVDDLAAHLKRYEYHGFGILGACTTVDHGASDLGVPDLGSVDAIVDIIGQTQADSVALAADHRLTPEQLRRLAWRLDRVGTSLFVAPSLMEVAGPRLSVHPVEGVSMLHVQRPAFSGLKRIVKDTYDFFLAGLGLLVLAPVLAAIAIAIKLDSSGPVFFRQTRVGRRGEPFSIVKFRSMVIDAESRRQEVEELDEGHGPLFKSRSDPRITKVGAFLRRSSLDELPQLWNVLMGDMSLVGPRPHLPDEVANAGGDFCRRLLVKPGMTGLWQVSGRSNLDAEESLRLDLQYVDNWSLGLDAMIIWKTGSAVVRGSGAF